MDPDKAKFLESISHLDTWGVANLVMLTHREGLMNNGPSYWTLPGRDD